MLDRVAHQEGAVVAPELLDRVENAEKLGKIVVFLAFSLIVFSAFVSGAFDRAHYWYNISFLTRFLSFPLLVYSCLMLVHLPYRAILCFLYRPYPLSEPLPSISFIIPAYNEGAMVASSIDSVAAAHYPHDRLEIFVVDDGSRDDTWLHIQSAAKRHPKLVTALRLPRNLGKRHALAEGFRRASGEVFVTIDSDSVIEPGALLALAGPFREARVGAVAGKVTVLNRRRGLIPRMLAVRFILSFDFLRAVQSTYGTVYCCPGALSAYRASAVRALLDRWLNQTFLGSRCTYGEDRALTNLLLASRLDTVYQRTAVVRTVVPHTYSKLCRMFLRWDRSYVREEIRYVGIVWRRPPRVLFLSLFETVVNNLRFPVYYSSLAFLVMLVAAHPQVFVRLLFAIGLFSSFTMLYYLRSERSINFFYGILYAYLAPFTLFWIFPYALLTVRARGWLTR
jgi:hyaluronan synthase